MAIRSSHVTPAFDVGREHPPARAAAWIRQAVRPVAVWHERAQQRRQLQALDDRMLRDLGLIRADVDAEVAKPFWLP